LSLARASEVGNVFDLGQKYGRDFDMGFTDRNGDKAFPVMGCYGIGITRLMGVIVETFHDDRGIVWPEVVAPARVHLANLGRDEEAFREAEALYSTLRQRGIATLWDDRDATAGVKLADADLIGLPWRAVVSSRAREAGGVELKPRTGDPELVTVEQLLHRVAP
jgi:prolyl-tRNA synthetase